ncbi:MAG: thiolase family protein [Bdellovibrionales bacterium]|nr:thiolase family protein [Bdellovibrionales bacterium]
MALSPVFLCAPKRTAIGSFHGALADVPAPDLGAHVIRAVLESAGVAPDSIQEVILGCVLMAGCGQAPARQAALGAGLPNTVQAMTINKVCSSGLKAVMLAADAVRLGRADAVVAGGVENMSRAPYLLPQMRSGARLGHTLAEDSVIKDALWDVYNDLHMGNCAELCAREYGFSREAQDAYAIESYRRATTAIAEGAFREEITPFEVRRGRATETFAVDEEPGRGIPEKMPSLRPVFQKDGTVTAANASSINDGAAALLVCSEAYVRQQQLEPFAQILGQGVNAQAPEWFTTAPVGAVRRALDDASLTVDRIDLFEINEAFAAVALACQKDLQIPHEKLNVRGGAVALGHPVGASGARILTTLLHAMKQRAVKRGAVGICNGGGEATAMVVERV